MEDNYKPSKEFTDHAWSEMKALLDKEMPDKGAILLAPNQKKQKGFLLLSTVLLLVAIAFLFFYYQSNRVLSDVDGTEINSTTELAILPQNGTHQTEALATIEKESEEASSKSLSSVNNSSNLSTTENPATYSTATPKTAKPNLASSISKTEKQAEATSFKLDDESIKKSLENVPQKRNNIKVETPFISPSENARDLLDKVNVNAGEEEENDLPEPVAIVQPINGVGLSLLTISEDKTEIDKFSNFEKLKNRLPIYGFIGGRNYEFGDNIDFIANLETVLRKGNSKFGFRTGIDYAQRSTTYLTQVTTIADRSFDDFNNDFMVGISDPAVSAQFYEERAELNSNPIKYHFIEIPVFLDYKISKRWSVHAGLSGKALVYSSTQNFGLLNGISLRKQDDAVLATNENVSIPEGGGSGDTTISFLTPQKVNVGASLGFNFMPTARLGLQARFSKNLRDIYPQLNGNQGSNSLELGLSWRLR